MAKGYRQGRLGEEIKKIISSMLLFDIKDPRLSGIVSVSDVEVTSDGSYATVYVNAMIDGDEEEKEAQREDILAAFNRAKGVFKREIASEIRMRHTPELIFKFDTSMEYGRHIEDILQTLDIKPEEAEPEE